MGIGERGVTFGLVVESDKGYILIRDTRIHLVIDLLQMSVRGHSSTAARLFWVQPPLGLNFSFSFCILLKQEKELQPVMFRMTSSSPGCLQ